MDGSSSHSARMWIWVALSGVAVVYLVVSSIRGTQLPYVNASDLAGSGHRAVRVAGKVAYGGIESEGLGDVSITFLLVDERGDTVRVQYTGARPDAFREGAQAVAEGTYDAPKSVFHAELLQAKCPSKYEVGTPGGSAPPAGTRTGA